MFPFVSFIFPASHDEKDVLARLIAAQLWTEHFEDDPFSRKAGALVRDRMLAVGAARDPVGILQSLMKCEATCYPFMSQGSIHLSTSERLTRANELNLPLRTLHATR